MIPQTDDVDDTLREFIAIQFTPAENYEDFAYEWAIIQWRTDEAVALAYDEHTARTIARLLSDEWERSHE